MLLWRQYTSEQEAHNDALSEMAHYIDRDRQRAGQMDLPIASSKPEVA